MPWSGIIDTIHQLSDRCRENRRLLTFAVESEIVKKVRVFYDLLIFDGRIRRGLNPTFDRVLTAGDAVVNNL